MYENFVRKRTALLSTFLWYVNTCQNLFLGDEIFFT